MRQESLNEAALYHVKNKLLKGFQTWHALATNVKDKSSYFNLNREGMFLIITLSPKHTSTVSTITELMDFNLPKLL